MTPTPHAATGPLPPPLPPDAPLPARKVLRGWLVPLSGASTARAIALLVLDLALWLAALAGAVLASNGWVQLACGLMAGFVIGRLFIVGHDACHQSLTPHRRLNRWLGRLAFLPSLTPYSLWDTGHNVVHHGYTNLRSADFVWAPLSALEYAVRSPLQRLAYRVYRSGWAPGVYYAVEIWWKRLFFPNARHMPSRRPVFRRDSALVAAFGLLWTGGVAALAHATGRPVPMALLTAVALPFVFWNFMIGFVVYVHHTHTRVRWFDEKAAWARAQPFVSTTVHLTFPWRIGALMHHIMEHTAHHVDMGVPLYRLKSAQARLEELLPGRIVVQPFSWRWYFATARACKLYETGLGWTDFSGRPTGAPA